MYWINNDNNNESSSSDNKSLDYDPKCYFENEAEVIVIWILH